MLMCEIQCLCQVCEIVVDVEQFVVVCQVLVGGVDQYYDWLLWMCGGVGQYCFGQCQCMVYVYFEFVGGVDYGYVVVVGGGVVGQY